MRNTRTHAAFYVAVGLTSLDAIASTAGVMTGILSSVALAAAFLLTFGWSLRGRRERRRLASLFDDLRDSCDGFPEFAVGRDPVRATGATLRHLAEALAEERSSARAQAAVRARIKSELRASEERYALALMEADAGWWEWDLKTGRFIFSARWRCMLGLSPQDMDEDMDEWCRRVHAADRERVQADLKAHLEAITPRFENEHRVLHRDGTCRWLLAPARSCM